MGQPCDPRITVHGAAITGLEGMWRENQFESRLISSASVDQTRNRREDRKKLWFLHHRVQARPASRRRMIFSPTAVHFVPCHLGQLPCAARWRPPVRWPV